MFFFFFLMDRATKTEKSDLGSFPEMSDSKAQMLLTALLYHFLTAEMK